MKYESQVKSLLLFFVFFAAIAWTEPPSKPPIGVPTDAKFFRGKWYRVYLEKVPWNRAQERCKALGGQLVTVPDAETWNFVKGLGGAASVWLGATDEKTEGVWVWSDGTPVTFTAWLGAGPDNAGGAENYLATHRGGWNDVKKSGAFDSFQVVGFICEWKK